MYVPVVLFSLFLVVVLAAPTHGGESHSKTFKPCIPFFLEVLLLWVVSIPRPGCPLARVPGSPGCGPLLPLLPPGSSRAAALLRQGSGNLLFLVPTLGIKPIWRRELQACLCGWAHCPGAGAAGPHGVRLPGLTAPCPLARGSIPGTAAVGWAWLVPTLFEITSLGL